jgi:integrase
MAVAMVLQSIVPFPRSNRASNKSKAKKVSFTQTRVEALRHSGSGPAPEYVYDKGKPGLAVRLTSTEVCTYVFVGRLHGKVAPRFNLGRVKSLPLAKARAAVDKIRGDVALGIDVVAQRRALRKPETEHKTLNEAFADFIAGERHRPNTLRDYKTLWTLYIADRLGRKPVKDITEEDVRKLHAGTAVAVVARRKEKAKDRAAGACKEHAVSEGAGPISVVPLASNAWKGHRTANKAIILLRAVLSFSGRKADNPAAGITLFRQSPRPRRLSDDEAVRFRIALESFEDRWRDFFTLSLLTGTRRQSLVAMRWVDVDLDRARWIVPATWSKHCDEIVIPLTREAVAVLEEMNKRRSISPWVFPSEKSRSGHIEEPKMARERLLKAAGIDNLWLHDLRRTFGSRLAETDASGPVIAAAMGHKSLQSARSYLHLQVDAVRDAMERASIKTRDTDNSEA